MIKAEHKRWARILFNPYINRLLRKSFSNLYLVNEIPRVPEGSGLLITPNHISWWDGFFIDYLLRQTINRKLYLMMLESSLRRYWFFQKLGAYSIDPGNPLSIVQTARYTRELLGDSRNMVVTYPQGEIEPFEKRPLSVKDGLQIFLKNLKEDAVILPTGFKIQFQDEKKPAVYCRFGKELKSSEVLGDYSLFIKSFTDNLDQLSSAANEQNFTTDLFT